MSKISFCPIDFAEELVNHYSGLLNPGIIDRDLSQFSRSWKKLFLDAWMKWHFGVVPPPPPPPYQASTTIYIYFGWRILAFSFFSKVKILQK